MPLRPQGGNVRYALKAPYRDGTTHVIFESEEFMVMVAIGAGLLALQNWKPVQLADAGELVGQGITGAQGHVCEKSRRSDRILRLIHCRQRHF